jgi:hypothetical protein
LLEWRALRVWISSRLNPSGKCRIRDTEETLAEVDDPELRSQLESLMRDRRMFLLEMGAAGQLLMSDELDDVLAVEDARLYEEANPLSEDGHIELDPETIEAREDAMVRKMLDEEPFAFIVLGDRIQKLEVGRVLLVRATCAVCQRSISFGRFE